jgi:hypothetical protein
MMGHDDPMTERTSLPDEVARHRRRWPIRLIARPLYWLGVLVASNVVADPVSTGASPRSPLAHGRLIVAGTSGPIATRLLSSGRSGWLHRVVATIYGPSLRWQRSAEGVRLLPDGEMASQAMRDIEIPVPDIAGSTSGRYSSRWDWVHLDLGDQGAMVLLVPTRDWAPWT